MQSWVAVASLVVLAGCQTQVPEPAAWCLAPAPVVAPDVRSALRPVVPAKELAFEVYTRRVAVPGRGVVNVAVTSNGDPSFARAFAVCVVERGVDYELHGDPVGGGVYVTAGATLRGRLGNCDVMAGNFYYLVPDETRASSGAGVRYALVSNRGFVPVEACETVGRCGPLSVPLERVEEALGLKLGGVPVRAARPQAVAVRP
jgi:hypothetical protein